MKIKTTLLAALLCSAFAGQTLAADAKDAKPAAAKPAAASPGAISANAINQAIKSLGLSAAQHKDKNGDPHFVLKGFETNAKAVAIYTDDCRGGRCEDITFYADFGPAAKLNAAALNEWNHIGSKLRSKAFRSGGVDNANGSVGLAANVSFLGDGDARKLATQLGLFLVEVRMMDATIKNLK